jgi:hypothetical protein
MRSPACACGVSLFEQVADFLFHRFRQAKIASDRRFELRAPPPAPIIVKATGKSEIASCVVLISPGAASPF